MTTIKVPRKYIERERPRIISTGKNYKLTYKHHSVLIPKEFNATIVYQLGCLREEEKNAPTRVPRHRRTQKTLSLRF